MRIYNKRKRKRKQKTNMFVCFFQRADSKNRFISKQHRSKNRLVHKHHRSLGGARFELVSCILVNIYDHKVKNNYYDENKILIRNLWRIIQHSPCRALLAKLANSTRACAWAERIFQASWTSRDQKNYLEIEIYLNYFCCERDDCAPN